MSGAQDVSDGGDLLQLWRQAHRVRAVLVGVEELQRNLIACNISAPALNALMPARLAAEIAMEELLQAIHEEARDRGVHPPFPGRSDE
jgi:hypothetical protein